MMPPRRGERFGSIGVTAVVDELFRGEHPVTGWTLDAEVDGLVAVRRDR